MMEWLSSLGVVGSVLRWVIICIEVIVVFNLMILVHEWGHFLAARWRGLYVDRFQIWFGKPIWKKTVNGVQYGLGCIPAGGFVSLPQMVTMEAIEGTVQKEGEGPLPPISALDKIIVAFAGPLFSFLLAALFACMVWVAGKPQSTAHTTTVIGYVDADSPAAAAGLKVGDDILKIDGQPIKRFAGMVDSVQWAVVASEGDQIMFEVERPGEGRKEIPVDPKKWKVTATEKAAPVAWWQSIGNFLFKRPPLKDVGIMGKQVPMVGQVQEFSPAEEAGIKANDLITRIDGQELFSTVGVSDYVKAHPELASVKLTIERGSETKVIEVFPRLPDVKAEPAKDAPDASEKVEPRRLMGIVFDLQGKRDIARPSPGEQLIEAMKTMRNTLGAVFSTKSDIGLSHLSGPAGIFRVYYNLFERPDGWQLVLWFSVILNVNLAILNLLPFPVLDGGHITLAVAEMIRRRPVQSRILEYVQMTCVIMLFGFMIWVTLKDLGDTSGGDKVPKNPWLPKEQRAPA